MFVRNKGFIVGSLAAVLAFGCSSQKSSSDPDSYSQIKQDELESERREYIKERQEQLNKLDTEISRLEARLENEAKFVDADEKADWTQELFELRQEQGKAQAELDRASQASPQEWAEMRSTVGGAVDTLQAGVNKTGAEITGLFTSDDDDVSTEAEVDLCDVRVEGTTAAIVESNEQGEQLVVQLTTQNQDEVDDLRERAERLSKQASTSTAEPKAEPESDSSAAEESNTAPEQAPVIASVTVENIQNGVRVVFTPAEGQMDTLRHQLEGEVE
jgi:hypothetical protein